MKDETCTLLARDLSDVITGLGHEFLVGHRQFHLWPLTLGKIFFLQPYLNELSLPSLIGSDPYHVILAAVTAHRWTCCWILAVHATENNRRMFFDTYGIKERSSYFDKSLSDVDLASLLVLAMSSDKTETLSEQLGIKAERDRLSEALLRRESSHLASYGAKSIFGSFIVPLIEMGLSIDEILYERGYDFLRLLLSDKQITLPLTGDESGASGALIDGDSADADQQLTAYMSSKGIS